MINPNPRTEGFAMSGQCGWLIVTVLALGEGVIALMTLRYWFQSPGLNVALP